MMFGPQVEKDAKAHAVREYPNECVGFVVDGHYVPQINKADDTTNDFAVDNAVFRALKPEAIIHSHIYPHMKLVPTKSDMRGQMDTGIPWGITLASHEGATPILWWGDHLLSSSLIGRQFVSGVFDCFSLARAYFKQRLDVYVRDFPRDEDWDRTEDRVLIEDNFARLGFVPVDRATARPHDVLLIGIPMKGPANHIAVLDEEGLMVHHLRDQLSRREPWTNEWRHVTKQVIRYVP